MIGVSYTDTAAEAQHLQGEVLERAQQFATALQDQVAVGPGKFDEDVGAFPVALLGQGRVHRDAVLQLESALDDGGAEKALNFFGRDDFVRERHGECCNTDDGRWSMADGRQFVVGRTADCSRAEARSE